MITLQNLLESDSLSTIVSKLNNNFQTLALSGGGPMGIRGEQGIPGLPGKMGPAGPTGSKGDTGLSAYMIPFATGTTGTTGPSSVAGPWPLSSYNYLVNDIGVGQTGDIYIDHYNNGYWMYLDSADATGQYSNIGGSGGTGSYPPSGTGYYAGPGWYFYPTAGSKSGGGAAGDLWTSDYTTYFTKPPYATGPFNSDATSPLEIANARFVSKYGTVWITAGNSGNSGANDYDTSTIGDWGETYRTPDPAGLPQPGRWNAGVDRLLFKMSIDSLPFHSVVNARSITTTGLTGSYLDNDNPAVDNLSPILGENYWVKPIYDTPIDSYTPLFFWSELRAGDPLIPVVGNERFATLGLYQFTATDASPYGTFPSGGITAGATASSLFWNDKKSLFLLSTRLAPSAEDYQESADNGSPSQLSSQKTINLSELVLDVKTLTTTNQIVCALPQDLKLSSDYAYNPGSGFVYSEGTTGANPYAYKVYQGFISSANGKNIGGDAIYLNYIDYGAGIGNSIDPDTPAAGNQTRRSWYGSGFRFDDVSQWSSGSSNPLSEGYVRLAGMTERGKKTFRGSNDDTYFLSELIFYTSQFLISGAVAGTGHNVQSTDIDGESNQQNSLPVFYVSPFRNLGIGTFASDKYGVWEPSARLHAHINTADLNASNDPTSIYTSLTGTSPSASVLISGNSVTKVAAFTAEMKNSSDNIGFIDFYLGKKVSPSAELANPYSSGVTPVTKAGGNFRISFRREGWYNNTSIDSFRLGVIPAATGTDIGQNLSTYSNEFQFAVHPLNKFATDAADTSSAISGVGVHNLWPRTRFHIYGKNKYNEADRGFELKYPGIIADSQGYGASGSYPYYTPNYSSSNQIIADYIGDSYLYPSGILEYDYVTYGGSPFAGVGTATLGQASPNAANYPSRDKVSPTRHYVPYGLTGPAGAQYAAFWNAGLTGVTGVSGAFNNSFRHDGLTGASYKPAHYLGFNIFRDLTNVGDDKDSTTSWVIGTNGGLENGGSVILTNNEGDFAISSIRDGRSGGESYAYWEQTVSTRDILNNIKLIVKKDGSVGFGNAAGYDPDAYSSQERDINTGYINYVPWSNKAGSNNALLVGPYSGGWASSYTLADYVDNPYGYVNYVGLSATYAESNSVSNAAKINSRATSAETIRAEFAADKLHGRPGRTLKNGGWGYPISQASIQIGSSDIQNYVILTSAFNSQYGNIQYLTLKTDFEGRLTQAYLTWSTQPTGSTGGTPISDIVKAIVFPHPEEFNTGGVLNSLIGVNFTAPIGAAAAAWDSEVTTWNSVSGAGYGHYLSFHADPLLLGNIRLNNFVAGEGYGVSGANLEDTDVQAIKEARQESPKLIFTFLEADNTNIPGQLDVYAGTPYSRPTSGTGPYRKVNTVIASAQNESSLREYWIPKSDNSGGTFMVFTDHYGQKEKDSHGLDSVTINVKKRMLLEEVVTLEFIYGYTGSTAGYPAPVTGSSTNAANAYGASGSYGGTASFPAHVLYKNRNMLEDYWPYYGYTGPLPSDYQQMFTSSEYAKIYTLGPSNDNTGFRWPGTGGVQTSTDLQQGTTGSTVIRNIDTFYSIYAPNTNYENGWGDPNVSNKASEFRFKRINTDFALVDFNITVSVRNPNLDTDIAYGEVGTYEVLDQSKLIDRGSPRLTQFIRMKYFPSAEDQDTFGSGVNEHQSENLFLMNLFGNGLNFANWSAFRNWYPGVAVVGPADGPGMSGTNTTTSTGEPHYMDNSAFVVSGACEYYNRWNGNLINYGAPQWFIAGTSTGFLEAKVSALTFNNTSLLSPASLQKSPTYTWTTDGNSGLVNFPDWYVYSQTGNMFGDFGTATDRRGAYFSTYMGKLFQLMGNRGFSRTRNCMWRIVPEFGNYYNDLGGGNPASSGTVPRNTFVLEIMFDEPILHVDTPFRDSVWGGASSASTSESSYFKYLTLSGQSILRFVNQPEYSWSPGSLPPAPGSTGSAGPCAPPPTPEVQILVVNNTDDNTGFDTDVDWIKVAGVTATYVSGSNYAVTPGTAGYFKTSQLASVPPGATLTMQLTSIGSTASPVSVTDTDSIVSQGTGPVGTTQVLTFSGIEIQNPGSSQSTVVVTLQPPAPVLANVTINANAIGVQITGVSVNGFSVTNGVGCGFPISSPSCPVGYYKTNQIGTYDIAVSYSNPGSSSPRKILITDSAGAQYCGNVGSGSGVVTFTSATVNTSTSVNIQLTQSCP